MCRSNSKLLGSFGFPRKPKASSKHKKRIMFKHAGNFDPTTKPTHVSFGFSPARWLVHPTLRMMCNWSGCNETIVQCLDTQKLPNPGTVLPHPFPDVQSRSTKCPPSDHRTARAASSGPPDDLPLPGLSIGAKNASAQKPRNVAWDSHGWKHWSHWRETWFHEECP